VLALQRLADPLLQGLALDAATGRTESWKIFAN
jgi:hypothetical protein